MSFECMAWAIKQKTGSVYNKAVLLHLANCTNHQTGMCRPRIRIIAEETEMSERSVQNALKDLSEKGFLQIVPRVKDGHQLANDYRIASDLTGTPFTPGAPGAPGGGGGAGGAPGGSPRAPGGVQEVHPVKQEVLNQEEKQEGTSSHSLGERPFIDFWNALAKESGLAEIREWTAKRANSFRALTKTYKATPDAMELATKTCHGNHWCRENRANVDHLFVLANFQRYLDKARTAARAVEEGKTGAESSGRVDAGNRPPWVAENAAKVEGLRREIATLQKRRVLVVAQRGENTLDAADIDRTIEEKRTAILKLGHQP